MSHWKTVALLCLLVVSGNSVYAQFDWKVTATPRSYRYDDIFFLNDSIGWAASGDRQILHTKDAGANWQLQFTGARYLRSIEFATPLLGFCGSLDTAFYKTIDGGLTWTDISSSINPRPAGICGLSAPDPLHIYACGVWRSPAFIIRSSDGGQTWSYTDMSAYASALVDIHFINKDTGFASGTANPVTDGGIILYTTNGGMSWEVKIKTQTSEDIIWKIQSPDSTYFFGSIQSLPNRPARMVRSSDKGQTWNLVQIKPTYYNLEMIGFIDRMTGWTGGRIALLKTTDGGITWTDNLVNDHRGFNRFFRVNAQSVYLSGYVVYKLHAGAVPPPVDPPSQHAIRVIPNPVRGRARIMLQLAWTSFVNLSLYTSDGRKVRNLLNDYTPDGTHTIQLDLVPLAAGIYFLVLKTNEGMTHVQVVKQ
ncbi:MAG TPA: T9SS type A sorting domain-containing protein [Chitinophagaceae bacterium]|nr:T9SS type A sorting domain-containing protein [Chitinophagaceae bacterium]